MTDKVETILADLKFGLREIYRDRLRGVYLYGSYARGEQGPESDLDILIILDEITDYAGEIDRTGEIVSRLSLDHGISISQVFLSERKWHSSENAFVRHASAEAIPA